MKYTEHATKAALASITDKTKVEMPTRKLPGITDRVILEIHADLLVEITNWQMRVAKEITSIKQRQDAIEQRQDEIEEINAGRFYLQHA